MYIGQLTRKRALKGVHRGSGGEGWGEGAQVTENRDKGQNSAAARWEEGGLGRAKQNYENVARKPAYL